jgi:hypothetical protein
MRSLRHCAAALAGGTAIFFGIDAASAHGFTGPRFFPATLATDDPFVADELSLPTVETGQDENAPRTTALSIDLAKRITSDLGIELGASYLAVHPPGDVAVYGFDNLGIGVKYQLDVDPEHETIFAVGLDADVGGTGASRVGAENFSVVTPAVFFGKGFGDLAGKTSWLRAFAVTGSAGIAIPTRARDTEDGFEQHPHALELGLAVEYSLIYLQSQVKNIGLTAPFDRMIPVVELALEKPFDRGGGPLTGTVNPGLLWAGQYFQLGAEAMIPVSGHSGRGVGFIAQLHLFIDDLFPATFGRPVIGG